MLTINESSYLYHTVYKTCIKYYKLYNDIFLHTSICDVFFHTSNGKRKGLQFGNKLTQQSSTPTQCMVPECLQLDNDTVQWRDIIQ